MDDLEAMRLLVERCGWPSEALIRFCEWKALQPLHLERPLLELGCGNGVFGSVALPPVDVAIDLEPHNTRKAARHRGTYRDVRSADATTADLPEDAFATVFANSVLTEVHDVDTVLANVRRWVRPGGTIVASVPVTDAFASSRPGWVGFRRRQLAFRNVWPADVWAARFADAGWGEVRVVPYLRTGVARAWDLMDTVASVGPGRWKLAAVVHRGVGAGGRRRLAAAIAGRLLALERRANQGGDWLAFVVAR